jgi:hypothetical protein
MALHLPDVQMAWPWTQLAGLVLAIPNAPMGLLPVGRQHAPTR